MAQMTVIGVLQSDAQAEQLIGNLRLSGFGTQSIRLIDVTPEKQNETVQDDSTANKGVARIGRRALIGAAIGLVVMLVAAVIIINLPGFGPVIGSGVLIVMFSAMGAILGALMGFYSAEQVSDSVINRYGMQLRAGQQVVTVEVPNQDRAKQAEDLFRTANATNVNSYLSDQVNLAAETGIAQRQ